MNIINKLGGGKNKIIVLAGAKAFAIFDALKKDGLKENIDFCDIQCFLEDWVWNLQRRLFVARMTVSVTTFCTFNCAKCSVLTPYNKNKKHFSYEMLKSDMDALFRYVDYVTDLVVMGGEPFLYPELKKYIGYVINHYSSHIGTIQIITNGTLVPDESILEVLKNEKIEVRISDYTNSVPYSEKIDKLQSFLTQNHIRWSVTKQMQWLDMGFPEEKLSIGETALEIRKHMLECRPLCQHVHDNKIYFCGQAWGAEQAGLYNLQKNDYVVMDKSKEVNEMKEQIRKLYYGNLSDEYYMSFCKVCRGMGADNQCVIEAGQQMAE